MTTIDPQSPDSAQAAAQAPAHAPAHGEPQLDTATHVGPRGSEADPPASPRLGTAALVVALIACAVPLLAIVLGLLSVASGEPALMMLTALAVVPLAAVLAVFIGLAAVILAVVLAVRTRATDRRWLWSLILGVVAIFLVPGLIFVLTAVEG